VFGRSELYQLPPSTDNGAFAASHMRGRILFGPHITHAFLENQLANGAEVTGVTLSDTFTYSDLLQQHGNGVIPLFLVIDNKRLLVFTDDNRPVPKAGQAVISLIPADNEQG
jgi:hypothetical protein